MPRRNNRRTRTVCCANCRSTYSRGNATLADVALCGRCIAFGQPLLREGRAPELLTNGRRDAAHAFRQLARARGIY